MLTISMQFFMQDKNILVNVAFRLKGKSVNSGNSMKKQGLGRLYLYHPD